MNPYYATGFITALYFWIWPVFIYNTLEAHRLLAAVMAVAIFGGLGLWPRRNTMRASWRRRMRPPQKEQY
jgi:hypothetical protein